MSNSYQDKLRKELRSKAILDNLFKIRDALSSGYETIYPDDATNTPIEHPLTKERASHLVSAANIDLRLLNKLLPDQKAVEVTDTRPAAGLTTDERVARLMHILSNTDNQTTSNLSHILKQLPGPDGHTEH